MTDEKFWDEVHKKAVAFRNQKRKEYLAGLLTPVEEGFVERWDTEPDLSTIKLIKEFNKKRKPEEQISIPKKMFPENLKEEPLALDVRLKCQKKN